MVGVIGVFYIASLFVPLISPYMQFPLHIVRCGKLPIAGSNFSAAYSYYTPDSDYYKITAFTNRYFCSEAEAQAAGYRKSVFND